MKRTELTAGSQYLASRAGDWDNPERIHLERMRVRVLTLDPWERAKYRGRGTREAVTETGTHIVPDAFYPAVETNGVLIEELDKATGEHMHFDVIQLAAIRGDWGTEWRALSDKIVVLRAAAAFTKAAREKKRAEAETLAAQLGGEVSRYADLSVTLTLEQARALLERLS